MSNLCWDVIGLISSYHPSELKNFRLVSKTFSNVYLKNVDLNEEQSLWLSKVFIKNKRDLAVIKKHLMLVKDDVLFWASRDGHLEIVKYLVSLGANIKAKYNQAVVYASENGHLEIVKYLVSQGADIKDRDNSAVIYASKNGHLETVKYLVSQGADIKAQYDSAVIYASRGRHSKTVRYLVSQGAKISALEFILNFLQIY